MTTEPEAIEAIYQAFVTGWADRTPYTFENEDYSPAAGAAWVRFAVRHYDSQQETLGPVNGRKFGRYGAAFTQIFVPYDTGMAGAAGHVRAIRAIFEGVSLAGTTIRFYNSRATENGRQDEWFMVVVESNFEYDETK